MDVTIAVKTYRVKAFYLSWRYRKREDVLLMLLFGQQESPRLEEGVMPSCVAAAACLGAASR